MRIVIVGLVVLMLGGSVYICSARFLSTAPTAVSFKQPVEGILRDLLTRHPVGSPRAELDVTLKRSGAKLSNDPVLPADAARLASLNSYRSAPAHRNIVPHVELGDLVYLYYRADALVDTHRVLAIVDPATDRVKDVGILY